MSDYRSLLQRATTAAIGSKTVEERTAAIADIKAAVDGLADDDLPTLEFTMGKLIAREPERLVEHGATLRGMSDEALRIFNTILPWAAMTIDEKGRIVGNAWNAQKRMVPHLLVDPRQEQLDKAYPLKGKHVLEVGCFEGIHTLGCILLGARVTAVDGRVENILKTQARLWAYGKDCQTLLWNLEEDAPPHVPKEWDVLHHIGVLYHLADPVRHLSYMLPRTTGAFILDTHIARNDATADRSYEIDGRTYRYSVYKEKDIDTNPFSGLLLQVKWLHLDDLLNLIRIHGFADVRVVEDRDERNGRRVLIHAFR